MAAKFMVYVSKQNGDYITEAHPLSPPQKKERKKERIYIYIYIYSRLISNTPLRDRRATTSRKERRKKDK